MRRHGTLALSAGYIACAFSDGFQSRKTQRRANACRWSDEAITLTYACSKCAYFMVFNMNVRSKALCVCGICVHYFNCVWTVLGLHHNRNQQTNNLPRRTAYIYLQNTLRPRNRFSKPIPYAPNKPNVPTTTTKQCHKTNAVHTQIIHFGN